MAESRTEKPTARRIRQARQSGDAPRSALFVSVLASVAVVSALIWAIGRLPVVFSSLFHAALSRFDTDVVQGLGLMDVGLSLAVWQLVPLWTAGAAAVVLASIFHVGLPFSLSFLSGKGFQPSGSVLFRRAAGVQVLEIIVALCFSSVVLLWTLYEYRGRFFWHPGQATEAQLPLLAEAALVLAFRLMFGFCLLALADLAYRRFDFFERLKMTRSEFLDDLRQSEGDPRMKQKRRSRHREVLQDFPLEQIAIVLSHPNGTVVPLSYQKGDVPRVLAVQKYAMAAPTLRYAREAGLAVLSQPGIVRKLEECHPGELVPESTYSDLAPLLVEAGLSV